MSRMINVSEDGVEEDGKLWPPKAPPNAEPPKKKGKKCETAKIQQNSAFSRRVHWQTA